MSKQITLYRALEIGAAEGRTLSGLAVPFDKPTLVRDLPSQGPFFGKPYYEALSPGSADVSIRQHDSFPVFVRHDYLTDPVGVVMFQRSDLEGGLIFSAPLSKTARADEMLELVNDGAMRSVSVGMRPIQAVERTWADARVPGLYRTEVGLRELSLAPTGFGQYADAGVLAVRMEDDSDDADADEIARQHAELVRRARSATAAIRSALVRASF